MKKPAVNEPRALGGGLRQRFGGNYSFGFFTSTLGTLTSFFSVPTVGTVTVSFTVPVSTLGVFTVSVSEPTTGFCTSYCPSPVFLHAPTVVSATRAKASASLFTTYLREMGPALIARCREYGKMRENAAVLRITLVRSADYVIRKHM